MEERPRFGISVIWPARFTQYASRLHVDLAFVANRVSGEPTMPTALVGGSRRLWDVP